jgi:uncharacterized protein (TIGR03000 family)
MFPIRLGAKVMMRYVFLWGFPLIVAVNLPSSSHGQTISGGGIGIGVGYGSPWGPFWGPRFGPTFGAGFGPWFGPGFGLVSPNRIDSFWGNGMSLYGPPVPTYRAIPGVFGAADDRFHGPPPNFGLTPWGWGSYGFIPLNSPSSRNTDSPRVSFLDNAGTPIKLEVLVPTPNTKVFIDNQETTSTGLQRYFNSPSLLGRDTYTYSIRAEWTDGENKVTHTKQVSGRPGDQVRVEFLK